MCKCSEHTCSVNHNSLINMDDSSVYWITEKKFQKEHTSHWYQAASRAGWKGVSSHWLLFTPGSGHSCRSPVLSHPETGDDGQIQPSHLATLLSSWFLLSDKIIPMGKSWCRWNLVSGRAACQLWGCTGYKSQKMPGTEGMCLSWPSTWRVRRTLCKFSTVSKGENSTQEIKK